MFVIFQTIPKPSSCISIAEFMFLLKSSYVLTFPGSSNSKGQVFALGKTESFCKTATALLKPIGGIARHPVANIINPGSLSTERNK